MSDSTPENLIKKAEPTLTERLMRISPRDAVLSIGFHLLIVALLLWCPPLREVPLTAPDASDSAATMTEKSPDLMNEVVERINETQSEDAAKRVTQLLELEKQMDELVKERVDAFNTEAETIAATAPQTALEEFKKVQEDQNAALKDQALLTEQIHALASKATQVNQTGDPAAAQAALNEIPQLRSEIEKLQESIKQKQIDSEDKQDRATQALNFVAPGFTETIESQQKANTDQKTASSSQQKAMDLQKKTLATLSKWKQQTEESARLQNEIAKLQEELTQLDQVEIPARQLEKETETEKYKELVKAQKDSQNKAKKSKIEADLLEAKTAQALTDAAKKTLETAQTSLSESLKHQKNAQSQLNQKQASLKKILESNATGTETLATVTQQLESAQKTAQSDQAAAMQQQLEAVTKLTTAQQNGASPAATKITDSPPPPPQTASLEGKTIAEIYPQARETEERIAEKYKKFRAVELATIRKITLDEALKSTQVARPDREKLDTDLLATKGAGENFKAYKEQVLKASQQLDSMVSLGQQMLSVAQSQRGSGQGTIDASAWLKTSSENFKKMQTLATADEKGSGKDLTAMMQGSGTDTGAGTGTSTSAGSPGGKLAAGTGSETGGDLGGATLSQTVYPRNAPELPTMDYKNLKPSAARRIHSVGMHHADWIYADSWYVIGPFENPGRRNLNTKFPPESIVDLNAVYPGKNGQPIQWKFVQSDTPAIRMPRDREDAPAIYYAYTEFLFDEARDLWIATGSDDKGTMWINDVMVWNSGDTLKGWIANEGYRKVHFSKGRNRILYRLENGQLGAVLSLMISTKPTGS